VTTAVFGPRAREADGESVRRSAGVDRDDASIGRSGESRQRLDRTVRNTLPDNASEVVSRDNASTGRSGIRVLETTPLAGDRSRDNASRTGMVLLPFSVGLYTPRAAYVPSGVGVRCGLFCPTGHVLTGCRYRVPWNGLFYMLCTFHLSLTYELTIYTLNLK